MTRSKVKTLYISVDWGKFSSKFCRTSYRYKLYVLQTFLPFDFLHGLKHLCNNIIYMYKFEVTHTHTQILVSYKSCMDKDKSKNFETDVPFV